MTSFAFNKLIIVGAGPAGLLLALLQAQTSPDLQVTVLEAAAALSLQPRATHYGMPAVRELRRAGILDEVRLKGFVPNGVGWRKLDGQILAYLDREIMGDHDDKLTVLGLAELSKIMMKRLEALRNVDIKWSHKVTGIGQDENEAWVDVESTQEGGEKAPSRFHADYIVGCDGASSQIRKSLFGENFPGFTWDKQIVATNTYYNFPPSFDDIDTNFIVHPEHWYMAARISRDNMWRITYGEISGLTNAELLARQPAKFEAILPGHPKPGEYNVVSISPYKVHQRCAEKMRVGRFLLAADAAHLCNPFGGLGLTSGIVDVGNLHDCLYGIHNNLASDSILDKYDEIRRQKYRDVTDFVSSSNIRRLFETDPETVKDDDPFLKMVLRCSEDRDFAVGFQMRVYDICHDFTKDYDIQNGNEHVEA